MLLLKGENYKSVVLNELMRNRFNECVIWDEPDVHNIEASWFVNSNEFNDLYKYIMYINDWLHITGENRDLLLIYTNKTEEDIKPLIEWIKDQEKFLNYRQVLITCR